MKDCRRLQLLFSGYCEISLNPFYISTTHLLHRQLPGFWWCSSGSPTPRWWCPRWWRWAEDNSLLLHSPQACNCRDILPCCSFQFGMLLQDTRLLRLQVQDYYTLLFLSCSLLHRHYCRKRRSSRSPNHHRLLKKKDTIDILAIINLIIDVCVQQYV